MATPIDPDFRARLAALNAKFAASVPTTMANIAAALAACRAEAATAGGQPPGQAALQRLHELLHGVAGSAGTFGCATLGREARRIEHLLREAMAAVPPGAGWEAVPAEVDQLLRWAARDPHATEYD